jgi:hypothetical protein
MKPTYKLVLKPAGLLVLLAALTACSQQAVKSVDHCAIDSNNNVDRMFSQVSDKLADNSCHYFYPEYTEQLVAAAKGAPGPENEARFAVLLRQSIERGVISKRQGQELFSQYFDAEFFAVKAEPRSSCSSLRRKEVMYTAMREELSYKREGMLEILEDEDRFREAQQHYNNLQLVLDAVEVACTQEL